MDTTTLLIIVVLIILLGGGGWYGRGAGTELMASCLGDPKDRVLLPIVVGRTDCLNLGVVGIRYKQEP